MSRHVVAPPHLWHLKRANTQILEMPTIVNYDVMKTILQPVQSISFYKIGHSYLGRSSVLRQRYERDVFKNQSCLKTFI